MLTSIIASEGIMTKIDWGLLMLLVPCRTTIWTAREAGDEFVWCLGRITVGRRRGMREMIFIPFLASGRWRLWLITTKINQA